MALIVQKFGGTSLGSITRLQRSAQRVIEAVERGDRLVVVVSAMAGETNRLAQLASTLSPSSTPHAREMAALLTTGEQVSASLMSICLQQQGLSADAYSGFQLPIITSDDYLNAEVQQVAVERLHASLDAGHVAVVGGYQGINQQGDITALGRGGSDVSAVAVAAALKADECQIFTDVDGVYTADPRLVPSARAFEWLSYEQLLAFSQFGAKVVQSRAVSLAAADQVAMRVLSSFSENPTCGTLISAASTDEPAEVAPRFGLTYRQSETVASGVEVSVVSLNFSEINVLAEKIKHALEQSKCLIHGFENACDRVSVIVEQPVLARCLCILHSQLGLDDLS